MNGFFSNTNRTNNTNEGAQTGLCHTDFTNDTDFSDTAMDYFLQLQGVTILNNTRILMEDSRTSLKICGQKEIEGCAEMGIRAF